MSSQQVQRLIDQPGNDMIVLPFHVQHPMSPRWMPLRDPRGGFCFVAPGMYEPSWYPVASAVQ